MKTEHYPSLELCKKLTEIGFHKTESWFVEIWEMNWIQRVQLCTTKWEITYVCPSVMEMLDVIPRMLKIGLDDCQLFCNKTWAMYEAKHNELWGIIFFKVLPNALAEMILWLHENNHIKF